MEKKSTICMSIDDNYLWPWMVTVYSAVINCESPFPKIILANVNNLLSAECKTIAINFAGSLKIDLEIVELDIDANLDFMHHFNVTIYSRILLMDILSEDFLWLDSDLILMQGWSSIFEEKGDNLDEGVVIRGVLDSGLYRERLLQSGNVAMLKSKGRYVNSGVLLMSPENWKKIGQHSSWLLMAQSPEKYGIDPNDQDILNYLCAGKNSILAAKYNYIVGNELSVSEDILIQHFAGPPKPWKLSKKAKEFFLGAQGINYFKPRNSISYYADTFLFYPKYWQIEGELFDFLEAENNGALKIVTELRNKTMHQIDFASNIKHLGMSFFSKKWR